MTVLWEAVETNPVSTTERLRVTGGYLVRTAWRSAPGVGAQPIEGSAVVFMEGPVEPLHTIRDYADAAAKSAADEKAQADRVAASKHAREMADRAAAEAAVQVAAAQRQRDAAEKAAKDLATASDEDVAHAAHTADETVVDDHAGEVMPLETPLSQVDRPFGVPTAEHPALIPG